MASHVRVEVHEADWCNTLHLRLENKQSTGKCYLTQFVAGASEGKR